LLDELCLAGLLTLLILAAMTDLRERRIPNWLTAGVAGLYPLYALVSPAPLAWLAAVGIAVAMFALGALLFARALIGGGDVKLIAAVSLWAGPELLPVFGLVTALAGGGLGLAALAHRRLQDLMPGLMARWPVLAGASATTTDTTAPDQTASAPSPTTVTLPYGVAIAAGGVAIIIELAKL
jgi:prepilin peptidase CpaA